MITGSMLYGAGSGKRQVELRPRVCAACGKHFEAHAAHVYRIETKSKARFYCSYSCYAPADREEREEYRKKMLGRFVCPSGTYTEAQMIRRRIHKTRERQKFWREKIFCPEYDQLPAWRRREIVRKLEGYLELERQLQRELEAVKE